MSPDLPDLSQGAKKDKRGIEKTLTNLRAGLTQSHKAVLF